MMYIQCLKRFLIIISDEQDVPVRRKRRGVKAAASSGSSSSGCVPGREVNTSCVETQTSVNDIDAENIQEVYVRMNSRGVLVEGGEVFDIGQPGQSQVFMGVKKGYFGQHCCRQPNYW